MMLLRALARSLALVAVPLLAPHAQGAFAEFFLEDAAGDHGLAADGSDLLSMLVRADGANITLVLTVASYPEVPTFYQLDVMPAGWQYYAACDVAPQEGTVSCSLSRVARNGETRPGPGANSGRIGMLSARPLPEQDAIEVTIPYSMIETGTQVPIEVFRATSSGGVTVTDSFVYPDRADIARAETEWWLPLADAPEETSSNTLGSAGPSVSAPARPVPGPGLLIPFAAGLIGAGLRARPG